MNKLFAVLLLSTLAMSNAQKAPLEGAEECLAANLPKLLKQIENIYSLYNQMMLVEAITALENFAKDGLVVLDCVKSSSIKALKQNVAEQAVEGLSECLSEKMTNIKYDIDRLENDYLLGNYINLIGDVQTIVQDTQAILECLGAKASIVNLAQLQKTIDGDNTLSCLLQHVPTLLADVAKIVADVQNGDYSSLIQHVQSVVVDGQALATCLQA